MADTDRDPVEKDAVVNWSSKLFRLLNCEEGRLTMHLLDTVRKEIVYILLTIVVAAVKAVCCLDDAKHYKLICRTMIRNIERFAANYYLEEEADGLIRDAKNCIGNKRQRGERELNEELYNGLYTMSEELERVFSYLSKLYESESEATKVRKSLNNWNNEVTPFALHIAEKVFYELSRVETCFNEAEKERMNAIGEELKRAKILSGDDLDY